MALALVIVDCQLDFCEGGSLAVEGGNDVSEAIAEIVASPATPYDVVVTTQDWHIQPGSHFADSPDYQDTWPVHCVAGSPGAELHPAIQAVVGNVDARFYKGQQEAAFSGFEGKTLNTETSLEEYLRSRGVESIDVVGIATDYCVKATALDGQRLGFDTSVVSYLTAGVNPLTTTDAYEEMETAGVYVY